MKKFKLLFITLLVSLILSIGTYTILGGFSSDVEVKYRNIGVEVPTYLTKNQKELIDSYLGKPGICGHIALGALEVITGDEWHWDDMVEVNRDELQFGDIVCYERKDGEGHTAFYIGHDTILSGNVATIWGNVAILENVDSLQYPIIHYYRTTKPILEKYK